MSRTHRNIPHDRWFRRPRTYALRRDLIAAEEEIREELGVNYLAGHFAKISNIPTAWDDLHISARYEVDALDTKLEDLYRERILGNKSPNWHNLNYSIEFDLRKNCFRVYRSIMCQTYSKVSYVPFNVSFYNTKYPVKLKMEWWYA